MFAQTLVHYDRLWNRKAFIEEYKKEKMFEDSLDEFENSRFNNLFPKFLFKIKYYSRAVVQQLVEEYKASERSDYLSYVPQQI